MICEMALILAIDVSGSVSYDHYVLQRDATATAIEQRIQPNPAAPLAIQVIMWEHSPHVVVPWTVLDSAAQVQQVAQRLAHVNRPGMGITNLTSLMRFSLDSFDFVPCDAERMVLDVSGDGISDEPGMEVQKARAEQMMVQVNGLPIVTPLQSEDIVQYFRSEVVTYDGFVIPANNWEDYGRAIRSKLQLEIAGFRLVP